MIILDSNLREPLYLQIYKQFRILIITGQITYGSKLPSTRELSRSLQVGRNTVEQAYLQLWSEGYLTNKTRSRFLVQKLDSDLFTEQTLPAEMKQPIKAEYKAVDAERYNFQYGNLRREDFPIRLWRNLSNRCLSEANTESLVSYNNHQGETGLRWEIMNYLKNSRGVFCQPDQIVVCSGIHDSLGLICQLFRRRSTAIAIEDPGYDGARNVFYNHGYTVIPVALENNGICMEELKASGAQMVYVTPSHQFPTGSIMPIQKRLELLDWAAKTNGLIIEDDYDSELRYNTRPIPAMQGVTQNQHVIYLGTFSKAMSPALRLSYMVLPQQLIGLYRQSFGKYHSSVPWLQQAVLERFMNQGFWDSHIRKICLSHGKKHDVLLSCINEKMGESVTVHGRNAGLHIVLEFNNGMTEQELIKKARSRGIVVYPVSKYWLRPERYSNNMVLLGFSGMSAPDIIAGVELLAQSWFGQT